MRSSVLRALARKAADPSQSPVASLLRAAGLIAGDDPDASLPGHGYYAPIGQRARRDLPAGLWRQHVERAFQMLDTHPLAARFVSLVNEWIKPSEFRPIARDERVQEVVEAFWTDPRNEWDAILEPLNETKLATGELFLPVIADPGTGEVVLDYFDPADVVDVIFAPGSNRVLLEIRYQPVMAAGGVTTAISIPVVGPVRDRTSEHFGLLMGLDPRRERPDPDPLRGLSGVLAFRWNCRLNSGRGRSDFVTAMDYWVTLDDFHAAVAERAQLLARFVGDVEIKGARKEDIDGWKERYRGEPQYGTVAAHSDREKWNLQAVATHAADAADQERMLRAYGSAATGFPPPILSGDLTEGNRAVAVSTLDAVYLRGRAKQRQLAHVVGRACRYAVDTVRVVRPERLKGVTDWRVEVETPELLTVDPKEAVAVLGSLASALSQGLDRRFVDPATARRAYLKALRDYGLEVDAAEVERALGGQPDAVSSSTTTEEEELHHLLRGKVTS
jgi:hypothetical protein